MGAKDSQGAEGCSPKGCGVLILDAVLKAAIIIVWFIIFSVIRLEVIGKILRNLWR